MSEITTYAERVNSLKALLEKSKSKIAEVLPRHVTAERLCKTALIAANKTPDLLQCTKQSFLQSVMTAAELGLDVSGTLGSAYLLPYNCKTKSGGWEKRCQLIVGYRGMIDLAHRSGRIDTIEAHVVCDKDFFRCVRGLNPVLEHSIDARSERGDVIGAYAIARTKNGASQFDFMTLSEINAVKGRSKASEYGPWVTDFEEMAKKSVTRRLCKYIPQSPELERALALDVEAETGQVFDVDDLTEVEAKQVSKTESVKERIGAKETVPSDDDLPHFDDIKE